MDKRCQQSSGAGKWLEEGGQCLWREEGGTDQKELTILTLESLEREGEVQGGRESVYGEVGTSDAIPSVLATRQPPSSLAAP